MSKRKRLIATSIGILVLAGVLALCAVAAYDRWQGRRFVKQQARELEFASRFNCADPHPLSNLIRGVRVLGLGEATHGTREFFALKHDVFRYAVECHGFNVFAMEASMPESFDIEDYVANGKGDARKAVAALGWPPDVVELVEWMRRHNADPSNKKKLHFYGFDMQRAPRPARQVLSYLAKVDPDVADLFARRLAFVSEPYSSWNFARLPPSEKLRVQRAAHDLVAQMDRARDAYVRQSGVEGWHLARQHARVVAQSIDYRIDPSQDAFTSRDRAMAENVEWILESEGADARVLLSAHNEHVAIRYATLGSHLRRILGVAYRPVALTFGAGSFRARVASKSAVASVDLSSAGTVERAFAAAGFATALLDLRPLQGSGWGFRRTETMRSIGASFVPEWDHALPFNAGRYDAIVFVADGTASASNSLSLWEQSKVLADPANLGLEQFDINGLPVNWALAPGLATFDWTVGPGGPQHSKVGANCLSMFRSPGSSDPGSTFAAVSQRIDAQRYKGRQVRVRVSIRLEKGSAGQAFAWIRVLTSKQPPADRLAEDAMYDRPVKATTWHEYTVSVPVSHDAESIEYGLAFSGEGQAYFDEVSLESQARPQG